MRLILQDKEKILKQIKPTKAFIHMAFAKIIILLILLILFFIPQLYFAEKGIAPAIVFIVFAILLILITVVTALLKYKQEEYWITNKRIIVKKGIIGHSITSIPYSKISDLIISKSIFEKIFSVGSIYIQTLAGQVSGKNQRGAEGYLVALKKPDEIQELIFKQMK